MAFKAFKDRARFITTVDDRDGLRVVSLDDFVDGFVHRDLARLDDDDVLLGRRAVERLDLAHDVHPGRDLPEDDVAAVEPDVFTVQMKNCEPFVSGPALAMDSVRPAV